MPVTAPSSIIQILTKIKQQTTIQTISFILSLSGINKGLAEPPPTRGRGVPEGDVAGASHNWLRASNRSIGDKYVRSIHIVNPVIPPNLVHVVSHFIRNTLKRPALLSGPILRCSAPPATRLYNTLDSRDFLAVPHGPILKAWFLHTGIYPCLSRVWLQMIVIVLCEFYNIKRQVSIKQKRRCYNQRPACRTRDDAGTLHESLLCLRALLCSENQPSPRDP